MVRNEKPYSEAREPLADPRLLRADSREKPYPESWEKVADLRVLRADPAEWDKLIGWRQDLGKRGWKLLRVTNDTGELVAVFGRTKHGPPTPP